MSADTTEEQPRDGRIRLVGYLAFGVTGMVLPSVNFIHHYGYPLLAPDSLMAMAPFALLGAALGAVMAWREGGVRVVAAAIVFGFLVDGHIKWLSEASLGLRHVAFGLGALFVAWLLRRHLATGVAIVLTATFLAAALSPSLDLFRTVRHTVPPPPTAATAALPPLLHIVLDEFMAPEGLPLDVDPDRSSERAIVDPLLANGFEVWGRSFARYYYTSESLSNLMNFTVNSMANSHWVDGYEPDKPADENLWLHSLKQRGYHVTVLQTNHANWCDTTGKFQADTCEEYVPQSLLGLHELDIPSAYKAALIITHFTSVSYFTARVLDRWDRLVVAAAAKGVTLPRWPLRTRPYLSLVSMRAFDRLIARAPSIGPGQAVMAHILLPHSPRVFDADCKPRSLADLKHIGEVIVQAGKWEDYSVERKKQYVSYVDQAKCAVKKVHELVGALRKAGRFDDMTIILHGDHGSRLIDISKGRDTFSEANAVDHLDAHSTLFARHLPGGKAAYRRESVSIDTLLAESATPEIQARVAALPPRRVILGGPPWHSGGVKGGEQVKRLMPHFAHGRILGPGDAPEPPAAAADPPAAATLLSP